MRVVLSVVLSLVVSVSTVSADDILDVWAAELKKLEAAKQTDIIGVPGYRAAEKIVGQQYGSAERVSVYVDATKVAVGGKVSELSFDRWSASIRLAAVQREDKHLRVLIAVTNAWHKQGIPNPVAKAMEEDDQYVSGEQLELLYRQVLVEQGMNSMHADKPEIWDLLED